jgi:hypothetical protein
MAAYDLHGGLVARPRFKRVPPALRGTLDSVPFPSSGMCSPAGAVTAAGQKVRNFIYINERPQLGERWLLNGVTLELDESTEPSGTTSIPMLVRVGGGPVLTLEAMPNPLGGGRRYVTGQLQNPVVVFPESTIEFRIESTPPAGGGLYYFVSGFWNLQITYDE